ncbi:MAG: hypothetical protein U9Q07_14640, partial [Planctomycetota bacterium]|nr:hypothetical protein [Planctomycetota bacterium]
MKKVNQKSGIMLCALVALAVGHPANPNAASSIITANAPYAVLANFIDTADSTEEFETGGFSSFPWEH